MTRLLLNKFDEPTGISVKVGDEAKQFTADKIELGGFSGSMPLISLKNKLLSAIRMDCVKTVDVLNAS